MQTLAMRYLERYGLVRKGSWAPLPLLARDLSNVKSKSAQMVAPRVRFSQRRHGHVTNQSAREA